MKRMFTLAILASAFAFQQSSAQIQKGEAMLGASLAIATNEYKYSRVGMPGATSKTFTLGITPQLGFGIGNNWILGVSAIYTHSKSKDEGGSGWSKVKGNSYGGGVFARKFSPIGSRFGFFGQADASYEAGKATSTGPLPPSYESKSTLLIVSVKPGGYFRANKRFIFETTIGSIAYTRGTSKPSDASKTVTSSLALTLVNTTSISFKVVL